ncbi:MAG: autotransporter-associated beta strand repeat-containing protein [Verrucomicrobia bacterium]|nr:autotransporter-associated beta strand repeat-containing protein [Verrucomicrobiota bacterium]
MKSTAQHATRSLATRFAAMAAAAPYRRSACLATLALGLAGFVPSAHADVLVYEPFAPIPGGSSYTAGAALAGNGGALGTTGTWTTFCNNASPGFFVSNFSGGAVPGVVAAAAGAGIPSYSAYYTGTSTLLASSSGGYAGTNTWNATPDHISAYIPLASSVIAALGDPAKPTWMSCVAASDHSRWASFSLAIGAGRVDCNLGFNGRGGESNGNAVGMGMFSGQYDNSTTAFGNSSAFGANVWSGSGTQNNFTSTQLTSPNKLWTRDNKPYVLIAKIEWGATLAGPHTLKVAAFGDGETLSVVNFDARAVSNTFTHDPSTFTQLSVAGNRYSVDEIRIAESFNTVIGGVDAAATGTYWAVGATGGDSGTWSTTSNLWAANPGELGTLAQSTTAALIFAGAPGTVTISGTVAATAGLTFSVNNYLVTDGTLDLTGADAAANTLTTTVIGDTATIASVVSGSNGLTKGGTGRLALTGTSNTYGGGTILSAGTLQIADTGSLGSGSVDFQGGTLQYPAGSGATAIDFSSKIPTVAVGKLSKIDTNGFDVTFGTAIGGDGGLTKSGSGSLSLGVTNAYTGPTTVSGGNLKLSASQTLTILSVTDGASATVNAAGVQTTTLDLKALSSRMDASAHPVVVASSANLTGLTVTLTGGTSFSLSNPVGGDVAQPTLAKHRTLTAISGTLDLVTTGYEGVMGMGLGANTVPVANPAVFSGNGVWTVSGSNVNTVGNDGLGQPDNHVWHYMALPTGDFDISCRVTASTGAAGIMARDNVNPSGGGNWTGIWANTVSAYRDNGATVQQVNPGSGNWLRITRVGDLLTTHKSTDGITYTPVQTHTFPSGQWGSTTYLGLALNAGATVSGSYDNVNFMGTATTPDLVSTNLDLTSGAVMDLNFSKLVSVGGLAFDGVAQPGGTYGTSSTTPVPDYVDDVHFTSSGTLYVITMPTAPTGVTATAGNASVGLAWNLVTGATGYSVMRSEISSGPYTEIGTPFSVSYTDHTASNGVIYYYVVAATNTAGVSPPSAEVSALPIAEPAGVIATAGNATVGLTWDPVEGATGYRVKRSETSGGPYTVLASPSAESYTDNAVSNGVTYYYVVVALNSMGEGPKSAQVSALPLGPYGLWATANGLTGAPGSTTDPAFTADPESDGTDNGLEWILGGNPLASDPSVLPGATRNLDGSLTLTFKRVLASIGEVSLGVQYGTDLDIWESVSVGAAGSGPDVNGVIIGVAPFDAEYDTITVTIPASNAPGGIQFARVTVTHL